jgi:hypothetical protein
MLGNAAVDGNQFETPLFFPDPMHFESFGINQNETLGNKENQNM